MFLPLRCRLSDQPARRGVALFARLVVVLVVTAVSLTAVDAALAGPPPGLPDLPVPDNSARPAPTVQQPQQPQQQPQPQPGQPTAAAPAQIANLTVRKKLAKLTFPCQAGGTAKLVVRYGHHRWTSATRKYACAQALGKASIRVNKSIAHRLSKPSRSVVAALLVKDGTTKSVVPVTLPTTAAFRSPTAHAAQATFWGDGPLTECTRWNYDDARGIIGTVTAHAPFIETPPTPGHPIWFFWRAWLTVYDGRSNQFSPWVSMLSDSYDRTVWNWNNFWIDLDTFTTTPQGIMPGTDSQTVFSGYDAWILTAGQSVILRDGVYYYSPTRFFHAISPNDSAYVAGDFCHFP